MKSILITLILSILMNIVPAIGHGTETSTSVEQLSKKSLESHASMTHETSDDECCHKKCICCVSSSDTMLATLEAGKTSFSFVISFNIPSTNNPHLNINLRPPILS